MMSVTDKRLKKAIKAAALELCCGDALLKERLLSAMQILDSYLGRREEWVSTIYSRAQDISDAMKSEGTANLAIESMDHPDVQRLAERILHLYAECHASTE